MKLDIFNHIFPKAFYDRMLVLATGQVLFSNGTKQLALYTPDTGPSPAWQPVVSPTAR